MTAFDTRGIVAILFAILGVAFFLLGNWLPDGNPFVVYFGRPHEVAGYFLTSWRILFWGAAGSLFTALVSLSLSGVLAVVLLAIGLRYQGWLLLIERVAAVSQTIPAIVIVAVALIVETSVFNALDLEPPLITYCVVPVTLALAFPPLANGAHSVVRLPIEIKALLRLWNIPQWRRIQRVYVPAALPSILTGVRTSATWAVGATLITEGMLNGVSGDSTTLGHFLLRPFSSCDSGRTTAAILVASALGYAVYRLTSHFQTLLENALLGSSSIAEKDYSLWDPN